MDKTFLSLFQPLKRVLVHDVFNTGYNGWMEIMPNFCEAPDFEESPSIMVKDQWPPVMLSTATFRYPGSHGALSGQYSLKVSTRAVANPYGAPPAPGSMGHAIKRLSFHHLKRKYLQFEMWFAYTAEQDKVDGNGLLPGLHESSIRAFGFGWDLQERGNRYHVGVRYLNAVDGKLQKKWQFTYPSSVDDKDWAYDTEGDWCIKGVDPFWFGKRYPDGRHDAFKDVPDGRQSLCYNETDCKINWQYARLLIDTEKREYVEMQCQDKTFDLGGHPIYCVEPYHRIDGLMNPLIWLETDTNRRVFLYVDSVVISQE
ncbi:DUF6772 family protein [Parapedobacter soli]|uniref:DUF6772 family protein n=1 Tax=Parapedobacter soli TaxID=416955 RepID=UPI0021C60FDD|nr:DUF6772 family protein [Parapedobacter soli]